MILVSNPTKEETARWMGYEGDHAVAIMDSYHDPLHRNLCKWLGLPSLSLADGRGERLTDAERQLACYEEEAVLHLQRFVQHAWKLRGL